MGFLGLVGQNKQFEYGQLDTENNCLAFFDVANKHHYVQARSIKIDMQQTVQPDDNHTIFMYKLNCYS